MQKSTRAALSTLTCAQSYKYKCAQIYKCVIIELRSFVWWMLIYNKGVVQARLKALL